MTNDTSRKDLVYGPDGQASASGYVVDAETHYSRKIKDEVRSGVREEITHHIAVLRMTCILATGVIAVIGAVFNWGLHREQTRLEKSVEKLQERTDRLAHRTDSISLKVTYADQMLERSEAEMSEVLGEYRRGFVETVKHTANLQGSADNVLTRANRALGETEAMRTGFYSARDSLGRSVARLDTLMSSQARRIDEGLATVTTRNLSGTWNLVQDVPLDVPDTPLRLVFQRAEKRRVSGLQIFDRHSNLPVSEATSTLVVGQPIQVDVAGGSYQITLVSTMVRPLAADGARVQVTTSIR